MVSLSQYTDAAEGGELPHKTGGHLLKNNFILIVAGKKKVGHKEGQLFKMKALSSKRWRYSGMNFHLL